MKLHAVAPGGPPEGQCEDENGLLGDEQFLHSDKWMGQRPVARLLSTPSVCMWIHFNNPAVVHAMPKPNVYISDKHLECGVAMLRGSPPLLQRRQFRDPPLNLRHRPQLQIELVLFATVPQRVSLMHPTIKDSVPRCRLTLRASASYLRPTS